MLNIGDFARLGHVSARMLRHYNEIGLLEPALVDPRNGYRLYSAHQLGRLHRIVALREMGFGLEQIGLILNDDLPVEELRGMLRLRQAQIEQSIEDERDRLHRVEEHLRALEWSAIVNLEDLAIKQTLPVRLAQATATGLTHADIGAAFGRLMPVLHQHLAAAGAEPGISIAVYEDEGGTVPEGEIVLHAGLDIGDQQVADSDAVRVHDLPIEQVASGIFRGPGDGIVGAWEALVRWIEDSGYRLVGNCREVYHEWDDDDPSRNRLELQQPVTR